MSLMCESCQGHGCVNLDGTAGDWGIGPGSTPTKPCEACNGLGVSQFETWPCNDCGLPCLKGDELCGGCYEKERRSEEWESMHPETRCPPRE